MDGRMQAISVKAVSEVLPSGTAGSCAEAEAGSRTLGSFQRDPSPQQQGRSTSGDKRAFIWKAGNQTLCL